MEPIVGKMSIKLKVRPILNFVFLQSLLPATAAIYDYHLILLNSCYFFNCGMEVRTDSGL